MPFIQKYVDQLIDDFQPYHKTKRMTYEDGLMLIAVQRYYEITKSKKYLDFLKTYFDLYINDFGEILNYHVDEYNIDNILAGNVLFFMYETLHEEKYLKAIDLLYSQLKDHPRTASGNFWHKQRYPYQVWLDGLYMGQVFYLRYALMNKNASMIDDIMSQVKNTDKFLWDEKRNLYVHAYDELHVMQWADKETGKSPNIWSRSVGWFAMALADLYELMPESRKEDRLMLQNLLNKLVSGVLKHLDNEYHMLYQVVDRPDVKGNYLETSGSAMIAYSILKGYRLDIFDEEMYQNALEMVDGIERKHLKIDESRIVLGGTCSVAGLDNEVRDGSVEYYLSEAIAENEIKGVGPYLFAKEELLRLKLKE